MDKVKKIRTRTQTQTMENDNRVEHICKEDCGQKFVTVERARAIDLSAHVLMYLHARDVHGKDSEIKVSLACHPKCEYKVSK